MAFPDARVLSPADAISTALLTSTFQRRQKTPRSPPLSSLIVRKVTRVGQPRAPWSRSRLSFGFPLYLHKLRGQHPTITSFDLFYLPLPRDRASQCPSLPRSSTTLLQRELGRLLGSYVCGNLLLGPSKSHVTNTSRHNHVPRALRRSMTKGAVLSIQLTT